VSGTFFRVQGTAGVRFSSSGSDDWDPITYTYDPGGRRMAKAYGGGTLGLIIDYLQLIIGYLRF